MNKIPLMRLYKPFPTSEKDLFEITSDAINFLTKYKENKLNIISYFEPSSNNENTEVYMEIYEKKHIVLNFSLKNFINQEFNLFLISIFFSKYIIIYYKEEKLIQNFTFNFIENCNKILSILKQNKKKNINKNNLPIIYFINKNNENFNLIKSNINEIFKNNFTYFNININQNFNINEFIIKNFTNEFKIINDLYVDNGLILIFLFQFYFDILNKNENITIIEIDNIIKETKKFYLNEIVEKINNEIKIENNYFLFDKDKNSKFNLELIKNLIFVNLKKLFSDFLIDKIDKNEIFNYIIKVLYKINDNLFEFFEQSEKNFNLKIMKKLKKELDLNNLIDNCKNILDDIFLNNNLICICDKSLLNKYFKNKILKSIESCFELEKNNFKSLKIEYNNKKDEIEKLKKNFENQLEEKNNKILELVLKIDQLNRKINENELEFINQNNYENEKYNKLKEKYNILEEKYNKDIKEYINKLNQDKKEENLNKINNIEDFNNKNYTNYLSENDIKKEFDKIFNLYIQYKNAVEKINNDKNIFIQNLFMNELINKIEKKYLNKILDIINEKDIYELMNFEEKINKMKTENNELNKIISNQKNEIDNLNNKIIDLEKNLDYVKMVLDSKNIIINNNNQQIECDNIEIEKLKEDKNKIIIENKYDILQKDNEIENILFTFDSFLKNEKNKFNNYFDKISENNKKKINEIIKNKKRE